MRRDDEIADMQVRCRDVRVVIIGFTSGRVGTPQGRFPVMVSPGCDSPRRTGAARLVEIGGLVVTPAGARETPRLDRSRPQANVWATDNAGSGTPRPDSANLTDFRDRPDFFVTRPMAMFSSAGTL